MPLRGSQARLDHRVVQCRGDLANASAGLLHHDAVLVSACRLVSALQRPVPRSLIEGEFFPYLEDLSVDGLARKVQVVVAVGIGRGFCGKGTDDPVLFLSLGSSERD